jgi:hypothetical protein
MADGGGLFLRVLPTGYTSRMLVYGFNGKRQKLALSNAADVSLAKAREAPPRSTPASPPAPTRV